VNAIFVWIPRTGGSSVWYTLQPLVPGAQGCIGNPKAQYKGQALVTFGHFWLPSVVEKGVITQEAVDTAWKFSFVRNPYDRTFSVYKWLLGRNCYPKETTFAEFLERKIEPPGYKNHDKFCYHFPSPQVSWLHDVNGRRITNWIGRTDKLNQDWLTLCDYLKVQPPKLKRINLSRKMPDQYTPELRKIVEMRYKADFELLETL
jgi:hypothetical protein